MHKLWLACAILLAQLLLLPTCFAQTRDIGVHGELLDRIAAVVNDGLVLKSELDVQMDAVSKRLVDQKVELPSQSVLRQQVLDRLILQEIEAQRAKRVGLQQFCELVRATQVVFSCNPSRRRISPLRIQLLTVPSGSFKVAAISVWLKPSK